MIKAVILSGGSGKRFGADIPKQYIEINGKPVLSYTLQAFQESCADEIIIVAGRDYLNICREIALQGGISKLTAVIEGGSERYYSVMNGLRYLHETGGTGDMVLIHDGARPFVSAKLIDQVSEEVREHGAAIAAVPCTDTIKITDNEGMIFSTTDRSCTWAAQTPQGFRLDEIYAAYEYIISDEDISGRNAGSSHAQSGSGGITDDAMVYQKFFPDRKVKAVLSDGNNIKITNPRDLELGAIILKQR